MNKNTHSIILVFLLLWSCQTSTEDSPSKDTLPIESQELLAVIDEIDALMDQVSSFDKSLLADASDANLIFRPFQNPPEIRSQDGFLDTELEIKFAKNQLYNTTRKENVMVNHRSYNGQLVGSTWRIKPGDRLSVFMNNVLGPKEGDEPCKPLDPHVHGNTIDPKRFNTTNLHVHGLHVSPSGNSDNVFAEIVQGCTFQNEIDVPKDHAQGTFWYHGHVHGSTAIQVSSGMSGAIIIEGGLDEVPEIEAMEEKIFVMQQMPYLPLLGGEEYNIPFVENLNFGVGSWEKHRKDHGWRTTINGQTIPIIEMAPNEVQRWRFIHSGVRETINLKLFDRENIYQGPGQILLAQPLHVIAEDGIAYGFIRSKNGMELQPGYRVDLLFQAPDKVGDRLYLMDTPSRQLGSIDGQVDPEDPKLLAIIEIKEKSGSVARKMPNSKSLADLSPYPSLVDVSPTTAKENMEFYIDTSDRPVKFQIDRKSFDPKNVRKLTLNEIQDWDLTSGRGSHPFHIHVNHFQLIDKSTCLERDSVTNACVKWSEPVVFDNPIWKDTYFVDFDEKTTIRTIYKDFTGKFVIHCHILDHEDQGMMQSVEILEEGQVSQLNMPDITMCDDEVRLEP